MNRAQEILDYLSVEANAATVMLTPGAPPMTRTEEGLSAAMPKAFSAGDIFDTLLALKAMTAKRELDATPAGTFSFGLRRLGRIRVSYLTQRGSKALLVERIPFTIPALESLCEDPAVPRRLLEAAREEQGGLMAVTGVEPTANGTLVYSLLDAVNQTARRLIAIVESPLLYLIAHRDSIVVQCEVGTDADSIDDAVTSVLALTPDILYVGGIRSLQQLDALSAAVHHGRLVIVSSTVMDGVVLLKALAERAAHHAGGQGAPGLMISARAASARDNRLTVTLD